MARKTQGWDIKDQQTYAELIKSENIIRRKWFQKNRQRLLNNLQINSSELVKNKLKKLRAQQALWDIEEPKIEEQSTPMSTQHETKDLTSSYMRPVDPKVLSILYEQDRTSHEARKNYLKERYKTRPEDKFYITDCTNWNYGWRLKDFPPVKSSDRGQTSIIKEMFFQKNASAKKMLKYPVPRWYQELSIPQIKRIYALQTIIKCDNNETVTGRTQKSLGEIGITSTFVKISSKDLKKLFKASKLDSARFLCEIYRYITGSYFEEEGYKKFYDCNERIVLSAIAFLKFTETIVELHRRLPMGDSIKFPKKPKPPEQKHHKPVKSPYLEKIPEKINWRLHRSQLEKWRERVNSIVKPTAILPNIENDCIEHIDSSPDIDESRGRGQFIKKRIIRSQRVKNIVSKKHDRKDLEDVELDIEQSIPTDDGIDIFSELDLYIRNRPKKFYPPGRNNLSRRWQSWLNDRDAEFETLAKEADCLLDKVRETTRLIFNSDVCYSMSCCACQQTRKMERKKQTAKVPHLVIDSLILDDDESKHVIGALMLKSPVPSLTDSFMNLPQTIPSRDKIVKKKIICGLTTDDNGITRYIISHIVKDIQHSPQKFRHFPLRIKNVPPCNCKKIKVVEEVDKFEFSNTVVDEEMYIAKQYKPDEFTDCWKCHDENISTKIYRDFEKACKLRENRQKQFQIPIDHHKTCTQRFFQNEKMEIKVEPIQEECTKCIGTSGKCQTNPFKEIINQINKEKLSDRPKVSKRSETKEYKDNIKLSVGGYVQNENDENQKINCVLTGITLHTPITITPTSSSASSLQYPCSTQHHHWSVTSFTPKPKLVKPKKPISSYFSDKTKKISNNPIQKAIDELFAKTRQLDVLKECLNKYLIEKVEETIDITQKENNNRDQQSKITIKREKGGGDIERNKDNDVIEGEKSEKKLNLPLLMKIALKEMAEEGFLLAKLPDCHKIPQLQAWIMFREGFIITGKHKAALLEKTKQLLANAESQGPMNIAAPSMQILEKSKETLTRTDICRIERELKLKKDIYHSKIRKLRVLESRAMWNLMDYQMFPSLSFKQAYFVYQASKESDGHVERPYGFSRS